MKNFSDKYRVACTLSYGDIYGQVMIWLLVIFGSLASALALMTNPIYAFLTVVLILVISIPFLLFSFVTTLLNHIEFESVAENAKATQPQSVVQAQASPAS